MIKAQIETRLVCPAELAQPIPAPVATPAGAIIRANEPGDAYLDAKDAREGLLADRLAGAKAECPR